MHCPLYPSEQNFVYMEWLTLNSYRRIGYFLIFMRRSACLVFNSVMVDNYAAFVNCTPVDKLYIHFSWLGPELLVCCLAHRRSTSFSLLLQTFSKLFGAQGSTSPGSLLNLQVLVFLFIMVVNHDLFVCP